MTTSLELIADRFVVFPGDGTRARRAAVDLATGQTVEIHEATSGAASEHLRWASRCDRLHALHHPHIARLLDWGPVGNGRRFEAWRVGAPARIDPIAAHLSRSCATQFLGVSGWTPGSLDDGCIASDGGRAVVVPSADTGYESDEETAVAGRPPRDVLGVVHFDWEAVASVPERIDESRRLQTLAIVGPRGSGLSTALADLARALRLRGVVPVCPRALTGEVLQLLADRSIAVVTTADTVTTWRTLLALDHGSIRVRAVIFATPQQIQGLPGIALEQVPIARLRDGVRPTALATAFERAILVAARRSMGWPGRFARLLWGRRLMREPVELLGTPRAAEEAAVYGGEEGRVPVSAAVISTAGSSWPVASELTILRTRLRGAMEQIDAGRHVIGERTLREVHGFLLRRRDFPHAITGALALAAFLLRRGRTKDARVVLNETRPVALAAHDGEALVRVSGLLGTAAIDERRLEEADGVLSAAVASANDLASSPARAAVALAHARCLFWMGAYDAADGVLDAFDQGARTVGDDRTKLAVLVARSRVAVARGNVGQAMSTSEAARAVAASLEGSAIGIAACAAAFVHLSAGDYRAVQADARACIEAARRAHDPLLGLRGRLLAAEAARRQGCPRLATILTARVRAMGASGVPPILRARVDLLAALLNDKHGEDVARAQARQSGLPALVLFAPAAEKSISARSAEAVVDLVRCCQGADEDAGLLGLLCARLRAALQAAAVGCFLEERGAFIPVAADGGRLEPAIAARAAEVDRPIVPHAQLTRVEGGAAVRYAGRRIGALGVRWPAGSQWDCPEAGLLLATAAAAAGPALSVLAASRTRSSSPVAWELLGTSSSIADLRDSIERASGAPFSTLIEGESGSGKELVARAIHRRGPRRDRPFCTLNCAALPEELVESELFGHARGAFTGAAAERAGVFEEAHTGTLFLDEIGELSRRAQAKVLRTIQEGEVRRVGENGPRRVDVRLLAATNRDLREEVARGRFRLDLLYRLDVIRIAVPPLRDRRDDIALLAEHFWREATLRVGSKAVLGATTVGALARYDWPGNVRELQNVLAALAVRSPRRGVVPPGALPPSFAEARAGHSWRLDEARRTFDTQFIRAALARSGGHRGRAAEELGMTRQGLTKLMARLDVQDAPGT